MDILDAKSVQPVFTFTGKWKKNYFDKCMKDLDEKIKEKKDSLGCSLLLSLASKLTYDGESCAYVRIKLRELITKKLIHTVEYNKFISEPKNLNTDSLRRIYKDIGNLFFKKYDSVDTRMPFGTIKTQVINGSTTPKKRKKKDESSDNESNDESYDPGKLSVEKRNILACCLMRFVHEAQGRATVIAKVILQLINEKALLESTFNYVLYLNNKLLIGKIMMTIIKNCENVSTTMFLKAVDTGFFAVKSDRLEKLLELAKRKDLPEDGCKIIGKALAETGVLSDDKRRPFSQVEIRALIAGLIKDSKKKAVLKGYEKETKKLSYLPMKSGETPENTDYETDNEKTKKNKKKIIDSDEETEIKEIKASDKIKKNKSKKLAISDSEDDEDETKNVKKKKKVIIKKKLIESSSDDDSSNETDNDADNETDDETEKINKKRRNTSSK
jgi:hypothetical protein